MNFSRISPQQAKEMLTQQSVNLIDIRDEQSYQQGHIPESKHIDNHSVAAFIKDADKALPLIICCYHGNSSQSAAQFFAEQSFAEVYSLDGGFEQWKTLYPQACEQATRE